MSCRNRAVSGWAILAVLLATAAFMTGGAQPALACSCPEPPPPEDALDEADAVFTGEVLTVGSAPPDRASARIDVVFDVSEVWDGDVHERQGVTTESHTSMCGYPFEEGREYLVYARTTGEGVLGADLCSRTTLLDGADEDLSAFGPGRVPLEGADVPGGGLPTPLLVAAGAAALLAVAAGWVLARRRSA
jgi:hypothetical protein